MPWSDIPSLIESLKKGEMVIMVDDPNRENEGDLIMAAACVTPEAINFMATYGKGLICMPMSQKRCEFLDFPLMVPHDQNRTRYETAFSISCGAAQGITTGISASDRAKTIKLAASSFARPKDFVRPGHVFPLQAHPDGVLGRKGHTEACYDLLALANFEPVVGVIVEILNADGAPARVPDLLLFSEQHQLKIGTIQSLLEYVKAKNEEN